MGSIAEQYADFIIITDDNPRNEDPKLIRNEIISGITNREKFVDIGDRKNAIQFGLEFVIKKSDQLIIAGKGHENTQTIGDVKYEFNDRKIILDLINQS